MMKLRVVIAACALFLAIGSTQAQETIEASPAPAAAPAAAAPAVAAPAAAPAAAETAGRFDGYRALAITAGVVGGAVLASILTDGLIIPAYAYLTGAEAGGVGAAVGAGRMGMHGAGSGMASNAGQQFIRSSMRLFGAVSGGLYADGKYAERSGE